MIIFLTVYLTLHFVLSLAILFILYKNSRVLNEIGPVLVECNNILSAFYEQQERAIVATEGDEEPTPIGL